MKKQETHGQEGHINAFVLDEKSVITAYGKHDRVVCFEPDSDGLYCRVDHVNGLGMPSVGQVLAVARAWPCEVKGRWKLDVSRSSINASDSCSEFFFNRA